MSDTNPPPLADLPAPLAFVAQGELPNLLLAARAALLEGDFDALAALTLEIEAKLTAPLPQDPEILHHIRTLAQENATLTEAAKRGVATMRGRNPEDGFSTYDDQGQRAAQSAVAPVRPIRY